MKLVNILLQSSLLMVAAMAAEKPNVIVVMADDLGYGDVSTYGTSSVRTPNVDRLAAEGVKFTSGYCSASTCTPTRYSFLTGSYAFRTKGTGVAPPNGAALIRPGTPTIANLFKQQGYATAVIGKWHLGLGDPKPDWNGELKPGPLEIGFDHCFLLPTTNDRVPQVYVEDHRVRNLDPADPLWVGDKLPSPDHPTGVTHRDKLWMDWSHGHNQTIHNGISRIGFYTGGQKARFRDQDLADGWITETRKWIGDNKGKPFFLFYALHDIHVPRAPHERFQGKSGLGLRGDAILELDWSIGELMKILDENGIAENTMVVFCSDNGPVLDDGYKDKARELIGKHQAAGQYRGGKYSVFEGGTRTPFIVRWKGKVKPQVSDQMVNTIDLAASFASLIGQPLPKDGFKDSLDVSAALLGKEGAKGREYVLQQDNAGQEFGLRVGNWKLVRNNENSPDSIEDAAAPNSGKGKGKKGKSKNFKLFDLSKDPGEKDDVSDEHPEELNRLKTQLEKIIADGQTRPM